MTAPYAFEECNIFSPGDLTPEQESLPWGSWKWRQDESGPGGSYYRSCVVPPDKSKLVDGFGYIPYQLFFKGVLIVNQQAARKGKEKRKTRRNVAAMILERLGGTPKIWSCFYCLGIGNNTHGPDGRVWHVDHFYPVDLGGDDISDNKILACATCNLSKGARPAIEFIRKNYKGGGVF